MNIVKGRAVLLPGHEHVEFGKPGFHYHIDWRFEPGTPRQYDVVWASSDGEDAPITGDWPQIRGEGIHAYIQSLRIPRMLCHWYRGVVVKDDICPHRGLKMVNGVCPGHGLCTVDGVVTQELYVCVPPLERVPLVGNKVRVVSTERCTVHEIIGETKDGRIFAKGYLDTEVRLVEHDILTVRIP